MAELGHLLAFLALASAASQSLLGFTTGGVALRRLSIATGVLTFAAFLCLIYAFVTLDFSVWAVAHYASSLQPIIYRVAAAWGNHEGSMLLWCLIMSGYGAAAAIFMRADVLRDRALGVQGLLTTASLVYLLFASSPFARLFPAPLDGGGLNPLLQDPTVALHPPMLYLGYVGMSFVFSIAAAGLINGKIDREWAKRTRPWVLVAWSALTIGIALGAIWAYYELGWGGWWFWDPVENASFMPWLVGAALIHSLIVTEKRGGMAAWTVFLAVLAFCLSMLGTFLVRSGVMTSVHAFAVDPKRGLILLAGLTIAGASALALYAWRAPKLMAGPEFDPVSREGALVLNNLFLSVGAALVLIGTVTPMFAQALNISISIGEPYFQLTFAPMMAVLLLFLPLAQQATWRRAEISPLVRRLWPAALIALVASVAAYFVVGKSIWIVPGVLVGLWVVLGVGTDFAKRVGPGGLGRVFRLPLSVWGMTLAHIGIGLFVIGATTETVARQERTFALGPGQSAHMFNWDFRFDGVSDGDGPNYYATRANISITHDGKTTIIHPEKRFYSVASTSTTEVSIRKTLEGDVYVALGDTLRDEPGVWRIRIAKHPLIDWVWGGALLIALGGFMSLASRIRRRERVTEAAAETPPAVATGDGGEPAGATA
ncbi:MAG: heme lyase CcmF/NrfE family subunit [Alphaproteobacteria bacterium]|nr:heme lyase CcmF/NrfE family subunit [Alphaproteobacteria bacterium]